jgi:hypothetical protein
VPSQVVGSVKSHISDLFNRVLSNQPQRPEARAVPGNNNAIVDLDAEAARAITTICFILSISYARRCRECADAVAKSSMRAT